MCQFIYRQPLAEVHSRPVVVEVGGVVGDEFFGGVFVAVDRGVAAVARRHAVRIVPCGLLGDSTVIVHIGR